MAFKLKALRRFRRKEGQALVWIDKNTEYQVKTAQERDFHISTKRGKSIKKGSE